MLFQRRILANLNRLEESKYQPDNVFLSYEESNGWDGDTEGRTVLALTLDAQAAHRRPKYLEEIIRRLPEHLNVRVEWAVLLLWGSFRHPVPGSGR